MSGVPFNVYATIPTPAPPDLPGARVRDHSDPEFITHLRGLEGYVRRGIADRPTPGAFAVIEHAWRTRCQLTWVGGKESYASVVAWAKLANGVIFTFDGCVRDHEGRVLAGPGADPHAQAPYPQHAYARRARIRAELVAAGYVTPEHLHPVICEAELAMRPPAQVRDRCLGLMQVIAVAELRHNGHGLTPAEAAARYPHGMLTSREQAWLADPKPSQNQSLQLLWRYEALATLLWVSGRLTIGFPGEPMDTGAIVEAAHLPRPRFGPPSASELLDELDRCFRLHWWVTERRVRQQAYPQLMASVVTERRHALAWLMQQGHYDWEQIELPT